MNDKDAFNSIIILSDSYEKLHSKQEIIAKNIDFKIALPYILINNHLFRDLLEEIKPSSSFRIKCMSSLFNSRNVNIEAKTQIFDDMIDSERFIVLKNDIELLSRKEMPKYLFLETYKQFMSDALPILYLVLKNEYPLSIFVSAAFHIGEFSILSLCFCFPVFVVPCFLNSRSYPELYVLPMKLASLVPSLRSILLPQISTNKSLYGPLLCYYLKKKAPAFLLNIPLESYNGLRDYLVRYSFDDNEQYYLMLARCCAKDGKIEEADIDNLMKSQNTKLIISVLSTVDHLPTTKYDLVLRRFQRNSEDTIELLEFIECNEFNRKYYLNSLINKYLGPLFSFKQNYFSSEFISRINIESLSPLFSDYRGLLIASVLLQKTTNDIISFYYSKSLSLAHNVNSRIFESIETYVNMCLSRTTDGLGVVLKILDRFDFFSTQSILEYPERSVNALYLTLCLPKSESVYEFLMTIPIRLIYIISVDYDVFPVFCKQITKHVSSFLLQSSLISISLSFLPKDISQEFVLDIIKNNPQMIDENVFQKWEYCRILFSFKFIVLTLKCFGAENWYYHPHQLAVFPKHILTNSWILKILLNSLYDLMESYFQDSGSSLIILHQVIELYEDPNIDQSIIGEFIYNTLLNNDDRLKYIMTYGFKLNFICRFAQSLPFSPVLFDRMYYFMSTSNSCDSFFSSILLLNIELSQTSNNNPTNIFQKFCDKLAKYKVKESEITVILDTFVYYVKKFPHQSLITKNQIDLFFYSIEQWLQKNPTVSHAFESTKETLLRVMYSS